MLKIEEELLIQIARLHMSKVNIDSAAQLIKNSFNWDSFYNLCSQHRLLPFLSHHSKSMINEDEQLFIPETILLKAKYFSAKAAQQQNEYLKLLHTIKKIFNSEDIDFMVLKGAAYYNSVYKKLGLRLSGDFDILIHSYDLLKADTLLSSIGKREHLHDFDQDGLIKMSTYEAHMSTYTIKLPEPAYLELHIDNLYYSNLNLGNLFQNANCDQGIKYPDLVDLFIMCCSHAWHHNDESLLKLGKIDTISLRELMDIRECYLAIQSEYKINLLKLRVNQYNMNDMVGNFLLLAQQILGDMDIDIDFISGIRKFDFDWKTPYFHISYEERLFHPYKVKAYIKSLYTTLEKNKIVDCPIESLYIEGNTDRTNLDIIPKYKFDNISLPEGYFWPNRGYYPYDMIGHKIEMEFSLRWDMDWLYLHAVCQGDNRIEINTEKFNYFCSHIMFIINKEKKRPEQIFYLQPKIKGNCEIFTLRMEGVALYFETAYLPYNKGLSSSHIYENDFTMDIAIRWEDIKIVPKKGETVYFDIAYAFRGLNPIYRFDMFWNTGSGNDCEYESLAPMTFI